MESLLKIGLGVGLVALAVIWFWRPRWFKAALFVFAGLMGAGVAAAYVSQRRRLRELGVDAATADRIASITQQAERIRSNMKTAEDLAAKDGELKIRQAELEAELRRITEKKEVNVEEVRAEIRNVWPDF